MTLLSLYFNLLLYFYFNEVKMARRRKTFEEKKKDFIKDHLKNEKWSYTREWFDSLSDEDFEMLIETNLSGLKHNTKRVAKKYLSLREVKKEKPAKKEGSGRGRGEIAYTADQLKAINAILKAKHPEKIKIKTSAGLFTVANIGISFNVFDGDGKKAKVSGAKIIELIEE